MGCWLIQSLSLVLGEDLSFGSLSYDLVLSQLGLDLDPQTLVLDLFGLNFGGLDNQTTGWLDCES